jgi:hypothetical protein
MSLKLNAPGGGSVTLQEPTTASNVTLNLPAANGTVVFENASGNVGIGTSSPGTRLHLGNNSNASELARFANTLANFDVGVTAGGCQLYTANNQPIVFSNNATERARIDASGNLLVGTTSAPSSSNPGVRIGRPGDNFWQSYANSTLNYGQFVFGNPNGAVGSITTSGSSTAFNTSSDYRLKENVQPMQNALAKVAALKPCTYTWKADGSDGEGFIAHELQEVVPECVTGEKDAVNEDGSIKPQGIDTSFLVATLTAAIQEQQQMIEELKAKVAALEAK